ncbi:hypothetical protein THRCLA_21357 [Thraustotheca clavata]|uniref:Choline transporter-like protein n=1 Tax=Thraustotheca clavata TaxID=74557 RepID=A0A1V9ZXG5_9STRA|nr:hypothetical protein THRCLA_21357 [Thraustotheca clavata]
MKSKDLTFRVHEIQALNEYDFVLRSLISLFLECQKCAMDQDEIDDILTTFQEDCKDVNEIPSLLPEKLVFVKNVMDRMNEMYSLQDSKDAMEECLKVYEYLNDRVEIRRHISANLKVATATIWQIRVLGHCISGCFTTQSTESNTTHHFDEYFPVIKNVNHTFIAGGVALWWYVAQHGQTTEASKRSLTTSFGSIYLGSLIVAILETIKQLLLAVITNEGIAAIIAGCLLGYVTALAEFYNCWAFVYVGIYGFDFSGSGKAVMQLFPFGVVHSSVAAIYVCFAEHPEGLRQIHPEYFDLLVQIWHKKYPKALTEAGYPVPPQI